MSEKLYGVDQFYPGDFAQILTGVYTLSVLRTIFSGLPLLNLIAYAFSTALMQSFAVHVLDNS